ncbi:hypothetical protein [Hyphomonas johnsonii]|jgi:hypothetical protein|uniref:Uncharacterized protein n=1 Tax=Hyphomonas johnsonii MHS-2 TaxID=1280950 RepID=A0A059FRN3_9PROT|nr:hypothetical protein [Hyphomonas johnsonii]KCZ93335.1 hypothetical protein HJO_05750 [Hyphomonas johnsonii MHS-2]
MNSNSAIDNSAQEDLQVLATILENERKGHCHIRSICFGMFVFSFLLLVGAMGVIGFSFISSVSSGGEKASPMILQVLAPLSAAMIGFFASWCAAHNCINSIDRSLYAAQARKYQLFEGFVRELQCASKKKRSLLLDMVGSVLA